MSAENRPTLALLVFPLRVARNQNDAWILLDANYEALTLEQLEHVVHACNSHVQLVSRIAELEKLVYVPGHWRCAKCEFYCISTTLHAESGKFSVNNSQQDCSNGCGPMRRVTKRDAGNTLVGRYEILASRRDDLVLALERAEQEITADKGGRVWTCLQVIRTALAAAKVPT